MDLIRSVERISQKFAAKGISVDAAATGRKLRRLVEEFGVNLQEAERCVTNELAREHGLDVSGDRFTQKRDIGEIIAGLPAAATPEWVTVEGKVVALSSVPSQAIAQSGIIADTTGAIRFVVWSKAGAPLLEEGHWYRFESAVVDLFRGAPNLKIHSGTTVSGVERDDPIIPSTTPVAELRPGVAHLRVKVVQEWEPFHERILQTGLVGDETGTVRFTIWKGDEVDRLEPGSVYRIYYAMVDEYNGRISISLSAATCIPEEGDIEVGSQEEEITGAIVHIAGGSGLVKRCPVDGCNRVLSRQNYCPVHEIQKTFRYDLRLKGVLDDGRSAKNILMQRDLVESLTGLTLEEAVSIAEQNPLGYDEVLSRIKIMIQGRYYSCSGTFLDDRMLVNRCEQIRFDRERLAALLNRAGGDA
ncbi:MAG: nucleotide-binding protein [Methanoculleaceae archaeon]